jgi:phospholipid N-methyltransferase
MFEDLKDFYPTPPVLISKMLKDIDFRKISTVLEPSAGGGHLAEAVLEKMKSAQCNSYSRDEKKYDIDCIEINSDLRFILQGKGFRVVCDDYLNYDSFKQYSLIVANYPFSEGDKHLKKSLDMISHGGQLVAIIGANTLKNPYSNLRKELVQKLEELNASIEYLQEEFVEAERSTSVEIAMIKVAIENTNKESIILNKLKQEEQYKQENNKTNTLIEGDFIKGIISQYQFEIRAGLNLINEYRNLQPLILKNFKKDNYSSSILNLSVDTSKYDNNGGNLVNVYIKKVRYKYWEALFNNEQFTSLLTTNLLYEYRQKISELEDYDFSYFNIKEIQIQMNKNIIKSVEDTILNLFEEFSHKHHWYDETSKNTHYYSGWRSNSCFKINKRVIIPLSCYSSITDRLDYTYKFYEKLKDIEHTFDYLRGGKADNTYDKDLREVLNKAQSEVQTKNIMTTYFKISVFKKGTCHLTFIDEELLSKFNIFGSKSKGWLPPSYGKASYSEMTKEEQSVIDEFQGKTEYNKVIGNLDYYLYNPSKTLMIAE